MNRFHTALVLYVYLALFSPVVLAIVLYYFGIWRAPWLLCERVGFAIAAKLHAVEEWICSWDWQAFDEFMRLSALPMFVAFVAVWMVCEVAHAFLGGAYAQAVR